MKTTPDVTKTLTELNDQCRMLKEFINLAHTDSMQGRKLEPTLIEHLKIFPVRILSLLSELSKK